MTSDFQWAKINRLLSAKPVWLEEFMSDRRRFLRTVAGAAALGVTTAVSSFEKTRRLNITAAMPDAGSHDRLQPDWYRRKVQQVQQEMRKRKLNALLLLDAINVIYTTGYFHLHTERPLAALIPESGDPALFIPELESDQVKLWWVKDYEAYFDYPGPVNRVRWIFDVSPSVASGPAASEWKNLLQGACIR